MIIINTDHCGTLDGRGSIFKAHCYSDDKHLPNKLAQSGKYFMCELSVCPCEALEKHQICSCAFCPAWRVATKLITCCPGLRVDASVWYEPTKGCDYMFSLAVSATSN